ncbi:MAG: KpsF/GutQ family sugar-phosphate isomerase [Planctomycetota bacterium]|jgi:arabinose-5-phosphate isomerase
MSSTRTSADQPFSAKTSQAWDDETILRRAQAVLEAESKAIGDALSRLDQRFVQSARAILNTSGRVCVTGVGKAGLIGQKIQATMASTGTPAYNLHPVEALHGDLGMVHADDIILALSKSGSSELVELLPRLAALGCRVILLTANGKSAAAEAADFVLDIGETPEACPLGLAPSSSTAAMLALGDALALTVMELKAVQPEQYASYHPGGALGRFLMKTGEMMRTGANCPTVPVGATLGDCYEKILAAPKRAGAAAVVDDAGVLVGVVTQGDFFRLLKAEDHSPNVAVTSIMTSSPKSVHVEARMTEALEVIRRHAIDELLVVDDGGKLAGLIDVQDLLDRGFSVFDGA